MLAIMWTRWMAAAATNAESSAIASTQFRPHAHQTTAVYGAMLPQPLLCFLPADEVGSGKTIRAYHLSSGMSQVALQNRRRYAGAPKEGRTAVEEGSWWKRSCSGRSCRRSEE